MLENITPITPHPEHQLCQRGIESRNFFLVDKGIGSVPQESQFRGGGRIFIGTEAGPLYASLPTVAIDVIGERGQGREECETEKQRKEEGPRKTKPFLRTPPRPQHPQKLQGVYLHK